MLQVTDLQFGYDAQLARGLNFTIDAGTIRLLHGPSGCGKSSFMLLLKAVVAELIGETTLSNLCNSDADMRRRTNATVVVRYKK